MAELVPAIHVFATSRSASVKKANTPHYNRSKMAGSNPAMTRDYRHISFYNTKVYISLLMFYI